MKFTFSEFPVWKSRFWNWSARRPTRATPAGVSCEPRGRIARYSPPPLHRSSGAGSYGGAQRVALSERFGDRLGFSVRKITEPRLYTKEWRKWGQACRPAAGLLPGAPRRSAAAAPKGCPMWPLTERRPSPRLEFPKISDGRREWPPKRLWLPPSSLTVAPLLDVLLRSIPSTGRYSPGERFPGVLWGVGLARPPSRRPVVYASVQPVTKARRRSDAPPYEAEI